jgi:hypothetical protein
VLPVVLIGYVPVQNYGCTIASQAISDYTAALQVARKPHLGHSTMLGGDEGCVTIDSNFPTNAIYREQQRFAIGNPADGLFNQLVGGDE